MNALPPLGQWTPGPWTVDRASKPPHHLMIFGDRGQSLGMVFERENVASAGNAKLISKAPELRDVLLGLVSAKSFEQFEVAADRAFALLDWLDSSD
jgi:hypothetical protein